MADRSDVFIAIGWPDKKQADEVLAVYALDENVQQHDLLKDWRIYDQFHISGIRTCVMTYTGEYVKWYDDFEDVQGLLRMETLANQFYHERGFGFCYRFAQLHEAYNDYDDAEGYCQVDNCPEKQKPRVQILHSAMTEFGNIERYINCLPPKEVFGEGNNLGGSNA